MQRQMGWLRDHEWLIKNWLRESSVIYECSIADLALKIWGKHEKCVKTVVNRDIYSEKAKRIQVTIKSMCPNAYEKMLRNKYAQDYLRNLINIVKSTICLIIKSYSIVSTLLCRYMLKYRPPSLKFTVGLLSRYKQILRAT